MARPMKQGRITSRPEGFYQHDRPNEQGVLLTGGGQHPWPRGHTPERQREVVDALSSTQFRDMLAWQPTGLLRSRMRKADPNFGLSSHREDLRLRAQDAVAKPLEAQVTRSIARSTMPASDLRGLGAVWRESQSPGVGAHYSQRELTGPTVSLGPQAGAGTLTHELGHHVSAMRGLPHSKYESSAQRGEEEAFADDYMRRHTRTNKGKSMSVEMGGGYEAGVVPYPESTTARVFRTSYRNKRRELGSTQFDFEDARHREKKEIEEPLSTDAPLTGTAREPRQMSFEDLHRFDEAERIGASLPFGTEHRRRSDWTKMTPDQQKTRLGVTQMVNMAVKDAIPPIIGSGGIDAHLERIRRGL